MKTIKKAARSLCSLATAVVFLPCLAAWAPHRVHTTAQVRKSGARSVAATSVGLTNEQSAAILLESIMMAMAASAIALAA